MPPMVVTRANGSATARYGTAVSSASSHASVGHGSASAGVPTANARPIRPSSHALPQCTTVPTSTAAKAPGTPNGIRTPPRSASSSTPSATSPASGSCSSLSDGRKEINRMATPAIEPRSAARGTTRRVQSPANANAVLATPIASVATMPTFHASVASPVAIFTGPSTPKTIANSVGVSMPNGMAVTSARPVGRMRRSANHVWRTPPTRTPRAVPVTRSPRTRTAGNPKTPIRSDERMTRLVMLSSAKPRKPLTSPAAIQRGVRASVGADVGGGAAGEQLPRLLANTLGERRAPCQLAAMLRDLVVVELYRCRGVLTEPQPGAIGAASPLLIVVERRLDARILALGVRVEEHPQPALDIFI